MKEAIEVAKIKNGQGSRELINLPYGTTAYIVPVSVTLLHDVMNRVKDPPVPMWKNPDMDNREEPNPSDPGYISAMADAQSKRVEASFDAMAMFGIDIVEAGYREDMSWLKRLQFLARRGDIDLEAYDLEDDIDIEFLYKRHIAASNVIIGKISNLSGVTDEDVKEAEKSFPGDEE